MAFDPDGEGIRRLNEWMEAEQALRDYLRPAKDLGKEVVVPFAIDQAYLDRFDALVQVRDATESAYRAWLATRLGGG
jgi:hypothetical protein